MGVEVPLWRARVGPKPLGFPKTNPSPFFDPGKISVSHDAAWSRREHVEERRFADMNTTEGNTMLHGRRCDAFQGRVRGLADDPERGIAWLPCHHPGRVCSTYTVGSNERLE